MHDFNISNWETNEKIYQLVLMEIIGFCIYIIEIISILLTNVIIGKHTKILLCIIMTIGICVNSIDNAFFELYVRMGVFVTMVYIIFETRKKRYILFIVSIIPGMIKNTFYNFYEKSVNLYSCRNDDLEVYLFIMNIQMRIYATVCIVAFLIMYFFVYNERTFSFSYIVKNMRGGSVLRMGVQNYRIPNNNRNNRNNDNNTNIISMPLRDTSNDCNIEYNNIDINVPVRDTSNNLNIRSNNVDIAAIDRNIPFNNSFNELNISYHFSPPSHIDTNNITNSEESIYPNNNNNNILDLTYNTDLFFENLTESIKPEKSERVVPELVVRDKKRKIDEITELKDQNLARKKSSRKKTKTNKHIEDIDQIDIPKLSISNKKRKIDTSLPRSNKKRKVECKKSTLDTFYDPNDHKDDDNDFLDMVTTH